MQIIKKLKGHSGSVVNLLKNKNEYFVHKNNIKNVNELIKINKHLKKNNFKVPNIIDYGEDFILMEYINGIDMFNFISIEGHNSITKIIEFIDFYYNSMILENNINYEKLIEKKINHIYSNNQYLNDIISQNSILEKIPKIMPQSIIHGDFTFDNMIYKEGNFYLIDISPTNLNSIHFDLNKLLQDLDYYWFLRGKTNVLNIKLVCQQISSEIKKKYEFLNNKYILIFMLLRIVPYCKDSVSLKFVKNNLKKVWQL